MKEEHKTLSASDYWALGGASFIIGIGLGDVAIVGRLLATGLHWWTIMAAHSILFFALALLAARSALKREGR